MTTYEKLDRMDKHCNKTHCYDCVVDKFNKEHKCGRGLCYIARSEDVVSVEELQKNFDIVFKNEDYTSARENTFSFLSTEGKCIMTQHIHGAISRLNC